jgi:TRAP-type C4-dicarboxylate transport system permease small subunit
MPVLHFIDRCLARLEKSLIVIFLGLMLLFTFVQVMLRALYTHAHIRWASDWMAHIAWSEPFARLLVLWLAFLGASLLTGEGKHIRIDLLTTVTSKKWSALREIVLSVACLGICATMFKACLDYLVLERSYGGVMFLQIPNWVGQLILPVGFGAMFFRFLLRGVEAALELGRTRAR